jgi:hypothetical protein
MRKIREYFDIFLRLENERRGSPGVPQVNEGSTLKPEART